MAPSIALRVPHEPKPETGIGSLQDEVAQLVNQKGPFNVITEQGLISHQAVTHSDEVEDDLSEEGDGALATETQQQTLDSLFRTRHQMTEELLVVHNHIITLVDTIAFAIASRSRIGETSISPLLRQSAPVGSVEAKRVAQRPPLRPETSQQYDEISTTTRAEAFKTAAEKLAAASKRLQDESQRQAQYWEQMAILRRNGWPMSRLPSNERLLILHFACGESAQQYQSRGAAILRQEDSGGLVIPGQIEARQQKVLSITIQRHGVKTGRFIYNPQSKATQLQVESDLVRAKESLFQEEMFNEIAREARLVANLGVKIRSSRIEVELSPSCLALITYAIDTQEPTQDTSEDQKLAEYVSTGLRMLLVAEYEQKRSLRTKYPPPPLTQTPRPPVEYAILRPLIAQLRHETTISIVLQRLERYQATIERAGFSFSFDHVEKDGNESRVSDNLLSLRKIVSTSLRLRLPTGAIVNMVVETYLGAPTFGTIFLPTTYTNICGMQACAQTSSTEDVIHFIESVLAQEVATVALSLTVQAPQWFCISQFPLEFESAETETKSKGLRLNCHDDIISLSFRKQGKPPKSATYNHISTQISSSDGNQESTELQLPELLRQWLS